MSLVNVARAMRHPRLRQSFQVERMTGAFGTEGRYVLTPTILTLTGIVQPADEKEKLALLPEGERKSAAISIYCTDEIVMGNGANIESDVITWHNVKYRIAYVKRWQDFGYWYALGTSYTNV